jgi:hypothetical protein
MRTRTGKLTKNPENRFNETYSQGKNATSHLRPVLKWFYATGLSIKNAVSRTGAHRPYI